MLQGDPHLDREVRQENKKSPLGRRDVLLVVLAVVIIAAIVIVVANL